MSQKLPPEIENKLVRLQEFQEQLKMLMLRRQQLELQLREVENALEEVEKLEEGMDVYKTAGYIMFKSSKDKVLEELRDKKETLELRIKTVQKQENLVKKQFEELRRDVSRSLSSLGISVS